MHRPRHHQTSTSRPAASARRGRERRVLAWGLLLSALIHALVIAWASDSLATRPTPTASPGPLVLEPPRGLRAVAIRPIPDVPAADPAAPEPLAEPEPPEPEQQTRPDTPPERPAERVAERVAEVQVPEGSELRRADRTAAERLAPRMVDPRLWEPMVLLPKGASIDEVEARVGAAVALLGDSALAAAERAVRSRDWTVESEGGKRWGISQGMLHLGDVKLPLPIFLEVDPDAEAERGMWYDLQAQIDRARILESFESRVEAIRERRDRERAERREGGG